MAAELANSLPVAQELGLAPAERAQWIVPEEREIVRVRAAAERIALEEAEQEIGPEAAGRAPWIVPEERETVRVRAAAERIALEEAELVRDRQLDQPVVGVANGSAVTARQRAVAEVALSAVAVEVAEATAEPAATEEARA